MAIRGTRRGPVLELRSAVTGKGKPCAVAARARLEDVQGLGEPSGESCPTLGEEVGEKNRLRDREEASTSRGRLPPSEGGIGLRYDGHTL
jgi:hypothetical protein